MSGILAANDQLQGSAESDSLGGYSAGDDTVNGNGGSDFVSGDKGNDVLNGGPGFDDLAYVQSFFDPTASHGIKLNTATGTVKDPWGNTDHFSNFEFYWGSKFDDVMKGSNVQSFQEEFRGLKGADKIDGKGGFDRVIYSSDEQFGGTHGIKADLSTGKVKDGFGDTNSVKHIEGVRGTAHRDTFIGDDRDNEFQGLGGKDKYVGGGGNDYLDFSANDYNGGLHGANVDLARHKAQVIDDGYGNTETATGFNWLTGSNKADTFLGNGHENGLSGRDGSDVLNGRGGNDHLDGDRGNDILTGGPGGDQFNFFELGAANADTITDFSHTQIDHIWLDPSFGGLSGSTLPASAFLYPSGEGRV